MEKKKKQDGGEGIRLWGPRRCARCTQFTNRKNNIFIYSFTYDRRILEAPTARSLQREGLALETSNRKRDTEMRRKYGDHGEIRHGNVTSEDNLASVERSNARLRPYNAPGNTFIEKGSSHGKIVSTSRQDEEERTEHPKLAESRDGVRIRYLSL